MAFPTIQLVMATDGPTASVTKTCALPLFIVPGELLILLLRSAGADTHSTPAGWTALVLNDVADASDDTTSIFWRIADGNEGLSVNVPGTASLKYAAVSMRISGHDAAIAPSISAAAFGTSTAPNSPALTPPGGAKDYLWLSLGGWEGEQASPPTYPTNYTLGQVTANSGTAGAVATNCQVASAGRQLNAASEDPGAYTISVSDDWTAWTIAVHPALPQILLEAAISAAATVAAVLTTQILLSSAVAASSSVSAGLTTQILMASAVTATGTVSADLTTQILMASAITASASVAGGLTTQILMASAISAVGTVVGDLTVGTQIFLEAAIAASAATSAALTTEILLASAVAASASVQGNLTTAILMASAVSGAASASAALTTSILLNSVVSASSVVAGELTTGIGLAGGLTASAAAQASLLTSILMASALSVSAGASGTLGPIDQIFKGRVRGRMFLLQMLVD